MCKQAPIWMLAGMFALVVGCGRSTAPVAQQPPTAESKSIAEPASAVAEPAAAEQVQSNTNVSTPPAEPAAEPSGEVITASEEPAQEAAAAPAVETKTSALQPAVKPAPAKPAAQPQLVPESQAARSRTEIINSQEFRRAVFEFGEWLSAQPVYTPAQVADIKNQFNHRVAEMDANQLSLLLADLQAKMKILNTPDAVEARAWLAQYLSVVSDSKRAQLLRDVPNVATMTAAQMAAEISRIEEKRAQMDSNQAAFQRGQAAQVANQIATDRTSQQNFVRAWNSGPTVVSPYSGGSNVNERLNNTPLGPGMTFFSGGWGGGIAFSPSAW